MNGKFIVASRGDTLLSESGITADSFFASAVFYIVTKT